MLFRAMVETFTAVTMDTASTSVTMDLPTTLTAMLETMAPDPSAAMEATMATMVPIEEK